MKNLKRFAAALAAVVLAASIAPSVVYATAQLPGEPSLPAAQTDDNAQPTATPSPTATPEPTATPTPTATPAPTPTPVPVSLTSCNIGRVGASGAFEAKLKVLPNESSLALRVYFTGDMPANAAADISGAAFEKQGMTADVQNGYVEIKGLKYTGSGDQVTVAVTSGGKAVAQATFTLTECQALPTPTPQPTAEPTPGSTPVPTAEPTPEPIVTPEPDPMAASLIIKSTSIGTESVNAGEEFTLKLTVYATTSGNRNAEDVVVSVTPGEGVTVARGSSSTYVGAMAPGSSQTVSFPMKALDSFTGGVSTIAVSVTGSGAGSNTNVSVPVVQPDRFEITAVECPEILMAGEEDVLSVIFVNKGRNPVNNLTVSLSGSNLTNPSQSEYVGNLAGGTQNSVDIDIAGMEAGPLTAMITVQYEGNSGDVVTLSQEVSCTIEEAYMDPGMWEDPGMFEEPVMTEPESTGLPLWAKILIGVAAAAIVVAVVIVVHKKRKAKKLALEADDDEDF